MNQDQAFHIRLQPHVSRSGSDNRQLLDHSFSHGFVGLDVVRVFDHHDLSGAYSQLTRPRPH